jgi:hypothetical protein
MVQGDHLVLFDLEAIAKDVCAMSAGMVSFSYELRRVETFPMM